MKHIVRVRRIELIDFELEAEDADDATARALMDGDEVASTTEDLTYVWSRPSH